MKKIFALLLALAMLLTLVACAGTAEPAKTETEAPAASETETPAAAEAETKTEAPAGKTYKVAMICDSSINDGGWGAACYNAMIAAAEK